MRNIAFTVVSAFVATLILGYMFIPFLRRLKFGQNVRQDGPKSHLVKSGTPTMGGLFFLIPLIVISLVFAKEKFDFVLAAVLATFGFGLIGFLDDYIKIVKKRSLGLRAYQKILGQTFLSVALAYFAYSNEYIGSSMIIPFANIEWDLGVYYIPVAAFIIIGTVNSVNLTDGLDGLCAGVTVIVSVTLCIIISSAAAMFNEEGLGYLAANYGNLALFAAALVGVCLGFLRYNSYPAQVFMGDTGSLGLGGAISALSILMRLPLWLPLIGGVYMAESISDIIQVASFKLRGKRVFKMAPLHHHFELTGMPETKVVAMFMIAAAILCLFALMSI